MSWPNLLHMKVRGETFSKPKLSHPKESRNRDREGQGWLILSSRREKTEGFQMVRVKARDEGRGDGGFETNTCWVESFLMMKAVLQTAQWKFKLLLVVRAC